MANRKRLWRKYGTLKKEHYTVYEGRKEYDSKRMWVNNKQTRGQESKLPKKGNKKLFYKTWLW
jgi:hypothetical protein